MARPYSLDLRERVVAAVDGGQTCRTVADTFGVSVSSVVKWDSGRGRRAAPRPSRWAAGALCCSQDNAPSSLNA
jgi:transposase